MNSLRFLVFNVTQSVVVPTPIPIAPNSSTNTNATYKIGDRIRVINNVNVRTRGLIDTSTLIGINQFGSIGTITAGPTFSDDRFGKITWYTVNFDSGFDGVVGSNNFQIVASGGISNPRATSIEAQIKVLLEQVAVLQRLLATLRITQ